MEENARREPRPILVPVDFSAHSAAALVWAAQLSVRLGSPLCVLHVVHDPESAPGYYRQSQGEDHLGRIAEAAGGMMADFLTQIAENHLGTKTLQAIDPIMVQGLPVTRILEVADQLDASMIVMGSQGRTGLPHLLLGSKAERVAQLAKVPVTIVKDPQETRGRPHGNA